MVKRGEEFLKGRKDWKKTLYVTLGNEQGDILEGFKQFREVVSKNQPKSFEWEALQITDEDHGSVVMPSHYWALRKIFDGWQMPRDPMTGRITGGLASVDDHYKKISQKFGYTIPVPEALMNQIGYQLLLGGGTAEEAISVFKANVERYPASANVYDSLAEAYERSGRLELARQNYEKAYALGREAGDPNLSVYKANLDRVAGKAKQGDAGGKK
jgi:tetratricopeptide (TPR) repeat protein